MGRVKGRGRGRGERRQNLQLIDRHQSTPPSRTNQELRLPAYGVSQKNNVIGQAYFFLPLPLPPLLFLPSHLPSGLILLLSPIFLCHRIKDGGFIVAIRLTSFRPPKIRLHCRLRRFVEEFCQLCEEKMEKVERKRKTDRDLYEVEVVEAGYDAKKQLKIHFV